MKKIFALALAAVMTAGMATTAFALEKGDLVLATESERWMFVDRSDDGKFGGKDDIKYSVKKGESVVFGREDGGSKVAFPLYDFAGEFVNDKEDVKGFKVKADWKVGSLEAKPEIELVKVEGEYVYAVTFTLPESADTKVLDLAGELSVYKNSSDLKDSNKDKDFITLHIGAEYGYTTNVLGKDEKKDDGDQGLNYEIEDAEIVEFKDIDATGKKVSLEGVETLTLADIFEFEVDVTGQDKLNLKNNQDFNKDFADMYDYANIDFLTFEKEPTFNKNGQVWIYADEDEFIYEVTADGAKAIKGLKWDEDYEAWTFKTRTLGSYAISDVELDEKTVTEDKNESSKPAGDKENPDTGR